MDCSKMPQSLQPKRFPQKDLERVTAALCRLNTHYFQAQCVMNGLNEQIKKVESLGLEFETLLRYNLGVTLKNVKKVAEKEMRKVKPALIRLEENKSSLKKTAVRLQAGGELSNSDVKKMRKRLAKAYESGINMEKNVLTTQVEFVEDRKVDELRTILRSMNTFGDIVVSPSNTTDFAENLEHPDSQHPRASRSLKCVRSTRALKRSHSDEPKQETRNLLPDDSDSESCESPLSSPENVAAVPSRNSGDAMARPDEDTISTGSGFLDVSCGPSSNPSADSDVSIALEDEKTSINSNRTPSLSRDSEPVETNASYEDTSNTDIKEMVHGSLSENTNVAQEENKKSPSLDPEKRTDTEGEKGKLEKKKSVDAVEVDRKREPDISDKPHTPCDAANDAATASSTPGKNVREQGPQSTGMSPISPSQSLEEWIPETGRQSPLGASFTKEELETSSLETEANIKEVLNEKKLKLSLTGPKETQEIVSDEHDTEIFRKEFLNRYKIQNPKQCTMHSKTSKEISKQADAKEIDDVKDDLRQSSNITNDQTDREGSRSLVSTETQTVDSSFEGREKIYSHTFPRSILKKPDQARHRTASLEERKINRPGLQKSVFFNDVHSLKETDSDKSVSQDSGRLTHLRKHLLAWAKEHVSSESEDTGDEELENEDDRILLTIDMLPTKFDLEDGPPSAGSQKSSRHKNDNTSQETATDLLTASKEQREDDQPVLRKGDRSRLHLPNLELTQDHATKYVSNDTDKAICTSDKNERSFKQDGTYTKTISHNQTTADTAFNRCQTVLKSSKSTRDVETQQKRDKQHEVNFGLTSLGGQSSKIGDAGLTSESHNYLSGNNFETSSKVKRNAADTQLEAKAPSPKETVPASQSVDCKDKPQAHPSDVTKPPLPAAREGKPPATIAVCARFRKRQGSDPRISAAVTRERPISPKLLDLLPDAVRTRLDKRQSETARINTYSLDRERLKSGPSVQERAAVFKEFIRSRQEGNSSPMPTKPLPEENGKRTYEPHVFSSENKDKTDLDNSSAFPEKTNLSAVTMALRAEGNRIRKSTERLLSISQRKDSAPGVEAKSSIGPSFYATRFRSRSTSPNSSRDISDFEYSQENTVDGVPPSTGMDLQNLCQGKSSRVIRKEFFIRQRRSLSATPLRRQQSVTKALFVFSTSFKLPLREKSCRPCSVAIVDTGMVVVIDQESRNIHLFTSNFSHLDSLMTTDIPGKVCSLGQFTVAVSFPYKQKIQVFDIFHKVRKEREMTVNCSEWVVDIACKKGQIFALCKAGHIHILDERGRESRKVDCGVTGQIEVSNSADRIFINEQGRITCFNLSGKTMWSETKPHTRGAICFKDSVYVIDPTRGKITSVFFNELTSADLANEALESPYAACLANGGDKLLVTQYTESLESAKTRTVKVFVLDKS